MITTSARDRAEELLQNLQNRARELLDAEEGLAKTVGDLVEGNGVSVAGVRGRLEDLFGRMKGNKVWESIRNHDKVVALNDYRGEVERRFEDTFGSLIDTLPFATKSDLADLGKQLGSLNYKVNELAAKLEEKKIE